MPLHDAPALTTICSPATPAPDERYDELLERARRDPRPHWRRAVVRAARRAAADARWRTLRRADASAQIGENGVTYNVYADPQGATGRGSSTRCRCSCPPRSGARSRRASTQRATLLNACSPTSTAPQRLLREGAAAAGAGASGTAASCGPLQRRRAGRAASCCTYAADLARAPDGRWWVLGDRTQAPSGAGYALENRAGRLARVPADCSATCAVQRAGRLLRRLARQPARSWAPRGDEPPRVVLLTPGAVQRDLLRARLPRALPRLAAGRGQRSHGARRHAST